MIKNLIVIITLIGIFSILLAGCGSSSAAVANSPTTIPSATPTITPPVTAPSTTPASVPPAQNTVPSLKTEVIYFHLTQRCMTCLCFESRVKFIIETYYKDAISSGKMTFSILNAQEKQNADLAKKYKAVGSQLFVNTISNSVDHIKDIQDIWNWNCNNDSNGFMQKVRDVLDKSLQGQL